MPPDNKQIRAKFLCGFADNAYRITGPDESSRLFPGSRTQRIDLLPRVGCNIPTVFLSQMCDRRRHIDHCGCMVSV